MKLRGLLLGTLAVSGLAVQSIPNDDWFMPVLDGAGGGSTSHRSSGSRAHRRWRKARSSGRR